MTTTAPYYVYTLAARILLLVDQEQQQQQQDETSSAANSTSPFDERQQQQHGKSSMSAHTALAFALLSGWSIFLCITVLVCGKIRRHFPAHHDDDEEPVAAAPSTVSRKKSRRLNRKQQMEKELITMRVQAHDGDDENNMPCRILTIAAGSTDEERPLSTETPTTDEDVESPFGSPQSSDFRLNECPICFETFRVGELVSCSPEPTRCDHVYHHGCIQTWLLFKNHQECPCCREIFLPMDRHNNEHDNMESSTGSTVDEAPSNGRSPHECCYCQVHGLSRRVLIQQEDEGSRME